MRGMTALLLLFAAAAGTHTTTPSVKSSTARAISACGAVTRAEVQLALGRSVGKGREESKALESTCDYSNEHGQVTITIQRLEKEPDLAVEMAALQKEIPDSRVRPAGPGSFYLDIAGAGTQLHVVRGRDYLLVSILGF